MSSFFFGLWIPNIQKICLETVLVHNGSRYGQKSVEGEQHKSILCSESCEVADPLAELAEHRTPCEHQRPAPVRPAEKAHSVRR